MSMTSITKIKCKQYIFCAPSVFFLVFHRKNKTKSLGIKSFCAIKNIVYFYVCKSMHSKCWRANQETPETDLCERLGCTVLFGFPRISGTLTT